MVSGKFGYVLCFFCFAGIHAVEFPGLKYIRPSVPAEIQAKAVQELIQRKLPSHASDFSVLIDPSIGPSNKDTFRLSADDGAVKIVGTSGLAASWGFYYYLSQYCHCHISWAGDQLSVPEKLPNLPAEGVTVISNDRFRYYQNVCTASYSFVWWNWERWEQEIDWMAMNAINLPLAFNGQEAIWQRVYLKMGFTQEEIDQQFSGPAFLAWFRMGNMHGWGGVMTQPWHTQQVALQHKILDRMRSLGMIPVLPAFAGLVPNAITRLYPNVSVSHLTDWGHLNKSYCCNILLNFSDPLFIEIGKEFLTEYINEFGTDHVYNTDTFNEMTPKSNETVYLANASRAVYNAMTAADPHAVWVMQGWLFRNSFWQPPQVRALVTAVPQGSMIILDLFSEVDPMYSKFESYYGQPFIWCMLHNFGGTVGMYGAVQSVNRGPFEGRAFPNSTMIGTGLAPEGINQNNIMYEFMNENAWRTEPRDIDQWVSDYAWRRYGTQNEYASKAWQLLIHSVYNNTDHTYEDHSHHVIINTRPGVHIEPQYDMWYDPEDLFSAWDNMVKASNELSKSPLFRYDLVDVTRQSLQVFSISFYDDLITSFRNKSLKATLKSGSQLLELLDDLDKLLATCDQFLLGRWLESAKACGNTKPERKLYEYNARNQITLWGPSGNILDYANKQWAGLVRDYYQPRWKLFIAELRIALIEGRAFDSKMYNEEVFHLIEEPFTFDTKSYPTWIIGDAVAESQKLHLHYRLLTRQLAAYFKKLPQDYHKRGRRDFHSKGYSFE